MSVAAVQDLVGIPYKLGGRDLAGACCLGACMMGLERLGIPALDPWEEMREAWAKGWDPAKSEIRPSGWSRIADREPPQWQLRIGDLLELPNGGVLGGLALYVDIGWTITSEPETGVRLQRYRGLQPSVHAVWRWTGCQS